MNTAKQISEIRQTALQATKLPKSLSVFTGGAAMKQFKIDRNALGLGKHNDLISLYANLSRLNSGFSLQL